MRRASRQRLGLITVVAVLLAAALWQWQHDQQRAPGPLLRIDPGAVTAISLRIGHAPTEHYRKRGQHWWRIDGAARPADDGRLDELAQTAAAPVLSWRSAGDFEPARIGMAPPASVLTLNGYALAFGETSATGPQRYVQVGERIALISQAFTPRPPRSGTITPAMGKSSP